MRIGTDKRSGIRIIYAGLNSLKCLNSLLVRLAHLGSSLKSLIDQVGVGVALLMDLAGELETVGGELTACLLELKDASLVAFPVNWRLWRVFVAKVEVHLEDIVHELAVSDLILQFFVGIDACIAKDLVVFSVQVVVTRVDHLVLLLDDGITHGQIVEVLGFLEEAHGSRRFGFADALEVTDGLVQPGKVTELHNRRSSSLCFDGVVLGSERLRRQIVGVRVLHPVDGEEVTEA